MRKAGGDPYRTPFTTYTQKEVTLTKGEHRRHIIPSSLFIDTISAWKGYWSSRISNDDAKGFYAKWRSWQELYEELNNYTNNLIAGPGAENSAIGMYMHSSEKAIDKAEANYGSMSDSMVIDNLKSGLEKFSGFQQGMQKQLVTPVLSVFNGYSSAGTALSFAKDLHDNTAFDWPMGGKHFELWSTVYNRFVNVRDYPQNWSLEYFIRLMDEFLQLPHPLK
jgi:hypothetical protein